MIWPRRGMMSDMAARVMRCSLRYGWLVILAALLALTPAGKDVARAQEGAGSISIAEFHEIITAGTADIEWADGEEAAQAVSDLRARLAATSGVQLATGVILHPDLSFLDPDDVDATLARLHLLDSQLTLSANDDADARLLLLQETLQELGLKKILQTPPHQTPERVSPLASAGADALGFLFRWGFILAGGALLIFILGNWLSSLLGGFVEDAEIRRWQADGDAPITARQARKMAAEMAQTGNYREAVRHLYLSALFKLEETGFVPRDRSKTNRELLAAAAAVAPLIEHLQPVVDTFDQVWYGVREPDDATFRAYAAEIDQLERLLSHQSVRPEDATSSQKASS